MLINVIALVSDATTETRTAHQGMAWSATK